MKTEDMPSPRIDAARAGQTTYDGGPCCHCGGTRRYTTTAGCTRCGSKRSAARSRQIAQIMRDARAARDAVTL